MKPPSAPNRHPWDQCDLWVLFVLFLLFVSSTTRAAESPAALLGTRTPAQILRTMPSDTPPNQRLAGLSFIAGYEVIGTPVAIPADKAAILTSALKSPTAFTVEKNEEHMRPGVAYRFGADADAIDVLICFSCDKIAFIPAGADAITTTHQIAQPTRDALLDLAKALLPNDEAIQALPKIRSKSAIPAPYAPVPKDAPKAGQSSGNQRF